jgi:hypothetical protein
MKYYLKQLFCIHDFCYFPFLKKISGGYCEKYRFKTDKNGNNYSAKAIFQVIAKCVKCDKQKVCEEYFGEEYSEHNARISAEMLNNFREFKNNQSNK